MKVKIMDANKNEKGSKELPSQFVEPIRVDLIERAVLSINASERQAYGTNPRAGKRHSVWISKRRRDYRTSYGHGISRVPRKVLSSSGTQFNWVGAEMPGTVGGRSSHPPKADRIWDQKINEKENRKAIRSAIAATIITKLIQDRGHKIPKDFPFILDNKVESLNKTKEVSAMLAKLGFEEELSRIKNVNVRAGKGKNRGRKYQTKKGPLFVVSKDCLLLKSARNIPGIEVIQVNNLNAKLLAPGTHPGRLTLWSEGAIDELASKKLFTNDFKGESPNKQVEPVKEVKKTPAKATKPAAKKKSA